MMLYFLLLLKQMTHRFGNSKKRLTQQRRPPFNKKITQEDQQTEIRALFILIPGPNR